jgi:nucleotide-binding universal stress UspA family protein
MTVVVGVDGSPPSRSALRLAAQEARCRQVPLIAVSAYEPPLGKPAGGYPIGTLHTGDDERATTESALRDAVSKELGDQADQADLRVSEGLAGHVIVETARQTHAQLIVLAASEIFPIEIRAGALAVFFAIAQIVGAVGSAFYGVLIGNGSSRTGLAIGYVVGGGT